MLNQIKGSDGKNFTPIYIKNELINSELMPFTPEEIAKSQLIADENNYSSVNLTECEKEVKKYYNISENVTLIFKKTDIEKSINQEMKDTLNRTNPGVYII